MQQEIFNDAQSVLERSIITILKRYPLLDEISWTQYTPHFCDGSPCHFGVNDINITYQEEEIEWYELERAEDYDIPKDLMKDLGQLQDALQDMTPVLQEMYGDHVEVECTREGIESSSLYHD